jgi:delta(3,5)-delta(2,4)-dienoyl-CoA isomerase
MASSSSSPPSAPLPTYSTLFLERGLPPSSFPSPSSSFVLTVSLNRPPVNAMNRDMWREIGEAFAFAADDPDTRVVLLTSSPSSRAFTAGLDLADHAELIMGSGGGAADGADAADGGAAAADDVARRAFRLRRHIQSYQRNISSLEECPKPVVACISGACVGGGVDLIAAADVRVASSDATFSIAEAEVGLAADVGTLQRLPRLVGNGSLMRELVFTARKLTAEEAHARFGLLSSVHPDREAALAHARALAARIASLSPVAVQASKLSLTFSRDHSVASGLEHVAALNQGLLQTGDIAAAAMASMGAGRGKGQGKGKGKGGGEPPAFPRL